MGVTMMEINQYGATLMEGAKLGVTGRGNIGHIGWKAYGHPVP